jgi:NADH-quinone oxidoreductase subunit G
MIMLIGTNPRVEAPVLNARIRKAWIRGASVGRIGAAADLTYDVADMGTDRGALSDLAARDFDAVRDVPSVVIVGQGALREADGEAVLAHAMKVAEKTDSRLLSCTPPRRASARWMWAR